LGSERLSYVGYARPTLLLLSSMKIQRVLSSLTFIYESMIFMLEIEMKITAQICDPPHPSPKRERSEISPSMTN
jgi:hypothetical protein